MTYLKGQITDEYDTGIPIINIVLALLVVTILIFFIGHITTEFKQGLSDVVPSETLAYAGADHGTMAISDGIKWLGIFGIIAIIAVVLMMITRVFG